ncbi:MAG: Ppx/GppA family phosphatase [Actinobacteria bacterium]|nr:Ppx/GppA family phosphatase [Actinomycetota bacterium]
MTRVAAVDCGTNSIRLLVADIDSRGRLVDVCREGEVVRLGHGVDATGLIGAAPMERTLAACGRYAQLCREAGAEAVRFVATSASRDARNAADFVAGVERAFADFGVTPEVVSGDVEAQLSFSGATGDLIAAEIPAPYLVVDLGGGSTELVRGIRSAESGFSMDVGSVRMSERHLHSDPPTDHEIASATADVDAAIDKAKRVVDLTGIATLVGLAGSITTVTAHLLGLAAYDPKRIHLSRFTGADHIAAATDLLMMSRDQRAALPYMHPGRVDVIGAGVLVWRRVLERVGADSPGAAVVTSEHDILDGIALSLAR